MRTFAEPVDVGPITGQFSTRNGDWILSLCRRHLPSRELALEFGDGLLLGFAAADERVERQQRQRQVGRDGVVLEEPIVGVKRSSWKFFGLSC
jgi:hypothetical protein